MGKTVSFISINVIMLYTLSSLYPQAKKLEGLWGLGNASLKSHEFENGHLRVDALPISSQFPKEKLHQRGRVFFK
jgi:hypothetical protein